MPRLPPSPEELNARRDEVKGIAKEMLKTTTFGGFTLDQVAAQSTLSKGTIYKLYCSKDELFTALAVDMLERLYLSLKSSVVQEEYLRENVRSLAVAFIKFIQSSELDRRLFLATKNYERVADRGSELLNHVDSKDDQIVELITSIIRAGQVGRTLLNEEAMALAILSLSYGMVALYSNSQHALVRDQSIDLEQELVRGLDALLSSYGIEHISYN